MIEESALEEIAELRRQLASPACSEAKKIGIIGGLGPSASGRLYIRITELTDAAADQEHLDVTVLSCPWIPDRTAYLTGQPGAQSFVEPMEKLALLLEGLGCKVLAVPCNTAHASMADYSAKLSHAHFVSMIDETIATIRAASKSRPGILATDGTKISRVYDRAAEKAGMSMTWPEEANQRCVMDVIYHQVKAGRQVGPSALSQPCSELIERGCDAIILACTELSLVGMPAHYQGALVVDALDVLAASCIREAGGRLKS